MSLVIPYWLPTAVHVSALSTLLTRDTYHWYILVAVDGRIQLAGGQTISCKIECSWGVLQYWTFFNIIQNTAIDTVVWFVRVGLATREQGDGSSGRSSPIMQSAFLLLTTPIIAVA